MTEPTNPKPRSSRELALRRVAHAIASKASSIEAAADREALFHLSAGAEPALRAEIARLLSGSEHEDVTLWMLRRWDEERDASARVALLEVLTEREHPAIAPILDAACRDADPLVSIEAARLRDDREGQSFAFWFGFETEVDAAVAHGAEDALSPTGALGAFLSATGRALRTGSDRLVEFAREGLRELVGDARRAWEELELEVQRRLRRIELERGVSLGASDEWVALEPEFYLPPEARSAAERRLTYEVSLEFVDGSAGEEPAAPSCVRGMVRARSRKRLGPKDRQAFEKRLEGWHAVLFLRDGAGLPLPGWHAQFTGPLVDTDASIRASFEISLPRVYPIRPGASQLELCLVHPEFASPEAKS